jgi:hypothetical protein
MARSYGWRKFSSIFLIFEQCDVPSHFMFPREVDATVSEVDVGVHGVQVDDIVMIGSHEHRPQVQRT